MSFDDKTAVISITDYDYDLPKLRSQPKYYIGLKFDDVDSDIFEDVGSQLSVADIENKYHMMSYAQAKEIADFYKKVRNDVDLIICQCEYGQSRSAAIAAAILEYEDKRGIEIFADDRYFPNKIIFRKILEELINA